MQGLLLGDRYRLTDAIGRGGMGRVWRAHDEVLHRMVAIKELTAALYVSDSDQSVLLARTRAEARAAARINHSAVVTVHDVLEHDGRPWIVMELVEGGSLADAVKENGRIAPAEAARIGLWVLRALRAAHTAGVLHRDVKPGNVLLARDGRVLLTDFGIAQIEGDSTITRTGEVVGSVDYLAPERVRGHDPGPSADLWALGATLYTAVEGLSPFRRTSPLGTMQAVVEEEPEPPRNAGVLGPVIAALLRKDPADRPGTAETEQLLAEAAEGRRPREAQAYVPTLLNPAGTTALDAGRIPAPVPAPAAAHPSGTGPTSVAPPARSVPPRRQRRLRTLALVIAVAALVGGGTAVVVEQRYGDESGGGASGSSAPADDPAAGGGPATGDAPATGDDPGSGEEPLQDLLPGRTPSPTDNGQDLGAVPEGWATVSDPIGFGLALPRGWERQEPSVSGDLQQVDYTPDGGRYFLRVAVDSSPDYSDPYAHLADLDQQLGDRLVDYRRTALDRNTYRDRPGARWEYAWTALAKDTAFPGAYRAVDQMYLARNGVEYALYLAAPADEWDTALAEFETILRSWTEPGAQQG
ncbi:serine/threonine-protein kinase [Streptomyces sp. NPDC093252]|uniref:serine/threonine-protein kinase n=1 Tax=Streptomyces sp. NPDC093252 TaxID=3154980 RepID=UPI0034135B84